MTRKVFPNSQVIHVWVQQSQSEGFSQNRNLWFRDATLYSYSTPIANFVEAPGGARVCLITSETYSVTTSGKHMPSAHDVSCAVFYVPFIGAEGGLSPRAHGRDIHTANIAALRDKYQKAIDRAKRRREFSSYEAEHLQDIARSIADYAAAFNIATAALDATLDVESIKTHIEERNARNNTPQAIARREREAAKRKEREERKAELARLRGAERVEAWLSGEPVSLDRRSEGTFGTDHGVSCYIRAKGEELQTSLGARVPLDHAIRAFRFVKACKERGEEWHRNGHSLRVGHFAVDKIDGGGNMTAGCHFIAWSEIERLARSLGVFEQAASSDALSPSNAAA